ncbi:hypothetical protein C8Q76DRAFT_709867 [Earliella scabrosa]|nr:hypothetical protein C8Q76DRAFT_709867 [Earliella scabrosa]
MRSTIRGAVFSFLAEGKFELRRPYAVVILGRTTSFSVPRFTSQALYSTLQQTSWPAFKALPPPPSVRCFLWFTSTAMHLTCANCIDIHKLLEGHHRQYQARTGETIHVYAIAGPPVFGDAKENQWNTYAELERVLVQLSGSVDLFSLEINATLSVEVPIVGTVRLAEVRGNFYLREGWLYVDLSATVFGTHHGPVSIPLIPIPYVLPFCPRQYGF